MKAELRNLPARIVWLLGAALVLAPIPGQADFVILDDLIVDGSACIGFDCVNGESFGFDTIRLKEHNLRIKFDDTSTAASYPRNDWQITINDSANGGQSKFSIDDISGSRTPFTIEANARSHSLYVDDSGRIGIRTSTPAVEIHVVDGDTPTLRLDQDGSSGFAPQVWDVAGNETNFFVRDVTHGSQLPFRIRPDAPSSSLFLDVDGDVGFGTSSPDQAGHLSRSEAEPTYFLVENTNPAAQITGLQFDNGGTSTGNPWDFRLAAGGQFSISLGGSGVNELQIDDNTGNVTIARDLNVTGTKNFVVQDPEGSGGYIYFSALEGPEAGTYYRGQSRTDGSEVVIDLPRSFAKLTEPEGLTVQLTTVGQWARLYVAEVTPERLVVRNADGEGDVTFNYLVQGVRRGYADFEVERGALK